MSEVADCLAMSDTVERMIRNTNNWTLLPNQVENRIDILKFLDQHHIRFVEAMLTTVIPGEVLKGHMQVIASLGCAT